jgi:hypothetical protein
MFKILDQSYLYKKLDFHKQVRLINGDNKDAFISLFMLVVSFCSPTGSSSYQSLHFKDTFLKWKL